MYPFMTYALPVNAPLLQMWDTAGQERFRSVTHAYYRDAQGKYATFILLQFF